MKVGSENPQKFIHVTSRHRQEDASGRSSPTRTPTRNFPMGHDFLYEREE